MNSFVISFVFDRCKSKWFAFQTRLEQNRFPVDRNIANLEKGEEEEEEGRRERM